METASPSVTSLPVLSPRQQQALRLIERLTREKAYAPTGTELAEHMRISVQGVFCKLEALKNKGLITREIGVHRSLKLTSRAFEVLAALDGVAVNVEQQPAA